MAAEIAEKNGLTHDDIAWIVPHQANLRIIDATAKRLGVDMDKVMINIQNMATQAPVRFLFVYGNGESIEKRR
mgnify:CR=1 FL=1